MCVWDSIWLNFMVFKKRAEVALIIFTVLTINKSKSFHTVVTWLKNTCDKLGNQMSIFLRKKGNKNIFFEFWFYLNSLFYEDDSAAENSFLEISTTSPSSINIWQLFISLFYFFSLQERELVTFFAFCLHIEYHNGKSCTNICLKISMMIIFSM